MAVLLSGILSLSIPFFIFFKIDPVRIESFFSKSAIPTPTMSADKARKRRDLLERVVAERMDDWRHVSKVTVFALSTSGCGLSGLVERNVPDAIQSLAKIIEECETSSSESKAAVQLLTSIVDRFSGSDVSIDVIRSCIKILHSATKAAPDTVSDSFDIVFKYVLNTDAIYPSLKRDVSAILYDYPLAEMWKWLKYEAYRELVEIAIENAKGIEVAPPRAV